jgi:ribosome biogenesis SPOUT family RNA methylase Rps3
MKKMRALTLRKYDEVTAYIMEHIEDYTRYTKEELDELKNRPGGRKIESNIKPEFKIL